MINTVKNYIFNLIFWRWISFISFIFFFKDLSFRKIIIYSSSYYNMRFLKRTIKLREDLKDFHDSYINAWLLGILILVFRVLTRCYLREWISKTFVARFRVELRWIFFPSFILLGIGIPRIDFLYKLEEGAKDRIFSFKRMGYQWFWTYENYNQRNTLRLEIGESYIKKEEEEDNFLNYVNSDVIINVPNFTSITNLISSRDVIHRWAIPSLIIKADAIPGRLNSLNFEFNSLTLEKHYGQCSELCGANHSFMPIVLIINKN